MSPGKCFLCSENKSEVRKPEKDVVKKINSCFRTQVTPNVLICGFCEFRISMACEVYEYFQHFLDDRNNLKVGCFLCKKQTVFLWEVTRDKRRNSVKSMMSECLDDADVKLTSKHRICYRCIYFLEIWHEMLTRFLDGQNGDRAGVGAKPNQEPSPKPCPEPSPQPLPESSPQRHPEPKRERRVSSVESKDKSRTVSKMLKNLQMDICNAEAFSPKASKLRERGRASEQKVEPTPPVRNGSPKRKKPSNDRERVSSGPSKRKKPSNDREPVSPGPSPKKRLGYPSGESTPVKRSPSKPTGRRIPARPRTVSRVLSDRRLSVDENALSDKRMMHDVCYVSLKVENRRSTRTTPTTKRVASTRASTSLPHVKIKIRNGPKKRSKSLQSKSTEPKKNKKPNEGRKAKPAAPKTVETERKNGRHDRRKASPRKKVEEDAGETTTTTTMTPPTTTPPPQSFADRTNGDVGADTVETEIENPNVVICPTKDIIEKAIRYKSGEITLSSDGAASDDERSSEQKRTASKRNSTSVCDVESNDDESQEMELKFEESEPSDAVSNGDPDTTKDRQDGDDGAVPFATAKPDAAPTDVVVERDAETGQRADEDPPLVDEAETVDAENADGAQHGTDSTAVDDENEKTDLEIGCSDEVVVSVESAPSVGEEASDADAVDPETAVQNNLANDKFQVVATMLEKLGA